MSHTFPFLAGPSSPAPIPIRPPLSPRSRDREGRKTRTSSFLHPIRLAFPRRSSSPVPRPLGTNSAHRTDPTESGVQTSWVFSPSTSGSPSPQPYRCLSPAHKDDRDRSVAVSPTYADSTRDDKEPAESGYVRRGIGSHLVNFLLRCFHRRRSDEDDKQGAPDTPLAKV